MTLTATLPRSRAAAADAQLLVSVEGNIGSGKSTLVREVAAAIDGADDGSASLARAVTTLQEPVHEWERPHAELGGRSMLHTVYTPSESGASVAPFQIYALMSRLRQTLAARWAGRDLVLSERCMASDRALFMEPQYRTGRVRPEEWIAYEACFAPAADVLGRLADPAVVVYLRCSPETAWRRVQGRGRAEENGVTLDFLREMHDRHEAWMAELRRDRSALVIPLDADDEGASAIARHVDLVVDVLRRLTCRFDASHLYTLLRRDCDDRV